MHHQMSNNISDRKSPEGFVIFQGGTPVAKMKNAFYYQSASRLFYPITTSCSHNPQSARFSWERPSKFATWRFTSFSRGKMMMYSISTSPTCNSTMLFQGNTCQVYLPPRFVKELEQKTEQLLKEVDELYESILKIYREKVSPLASSDFNLMISDEHCWREPEIEVSILGGCR